MASQSMSYQINATTIDFPLKSVFRIARGAKTKAQVIEVTITDGTHQGIGESVPYARYDESIELVMTQINSVTEQRLTDDNIDQAIEALPAGSARNALDCALWDLKAKQQGKSVAQLLAITGLKPVTTAQTLSIDTPDAMAKAVAALDHPRLVKVKLDNDNIIEKMTAIHHAAPNSQFIVDANEGWSIDDLTACCHTLKQLNVVLIEQPLPVGQDNALIDYDSPVPLCADESCHTKADLDYLKGRYQAINIKLDKTGGLTEAMFLATLAQQQGFDIMIGCMVASSLAMAPIALLANQASYVDLDGPLLIAQDRTNGFEFEQGKMMPLDGKLWGGGETAI